MKEAVPGLPRLERVCGGSPSPARCTSREHVGRHRKAGKIGELTIAVDAPKLIWATCRNWRPRFARAGRKLAHIKTTACYVWRSEVHPLLALSGHYDGAR
jgi:hypothetical protein